MNLIEIIPILIPTMIFQIIMQVYVIKHVWGQTDLKESVRIWWIVSFIVFNFLSISLYLFLMYKKDQASYKDEINPYFRRGILVITVISLQFFILQLIAFDQSFDHKTLVVWLGSLIYTLVIVNEVLVSIKKNSWLYLTSTVLFSTVLVVEYLTASTPIQIMVLMVLVGILNVLPSDKTRYIFIVSFVSYVAFTLLKVYYLLDTMNSDLRVAYVYTNILFFILVFTAFSSLKRHLIINQSLNAYVTTLKEQALMIEELTAKEERSRLAADIHDHVGHTLTTVVIQLESALTMMAPEQDGLKDKIESSKEQVKNGLNQIRSLVSGVDLLSYPTFVENMMDLIHKSKNSTNLDIHFEHESNPSLIPIQQRILLSATKEFFTNALKHGKAKEVNILLTSTKDRLEMTLNNDGHPSSSITYGYGLTHIDHAIKSIGGFIKVSSTDDMGFTLYLSIPLGGNADV